MVDKFPPTFFEVRTLKYVRRNDNMIVYTSEIDQSDLTNECWLVQFEGVSACEDCDVKGTPECGGANIILTGKNAKGKVVPL